VVSRSSMRKTRGLASRPRLFFAGAKTTGLAILALFFYDFLEIALQHGFVGCKIVSQLDELLCDAIKILFLKRAAAENACLCSVRSRDDNFKLDDACAVIVASLDDSALRLRLVRPPYSLPASASPSV
jgi:hypothetical protein